MTPKYTRPSFCGRCLAALSAVVFLLGGCGPSGSGAPASTAATSSSAAATPTALPKTPDGLFADHFGLALGAFHRYVFRPYVDESLGVARPRSAVGVKRAKQAAKLVRHELLLAAQDVRRSSALQQLAPAVEALYRHQVAVYRTLLTGLPRTGDVRYAEMAGAAISATSRALGYPVPVTLPTARQLKTGL